MDPAFVLRNTGLQSLLGLHHSRRHFPHCCRKHWATRSACVFFRWKKSERNWIRGPFSCHKWDIHAIKTIKFDWTTITFHIWKARFPKNTKPLDKSRPKETITPPRTWRIFKRRNERKKRGEKGAASQIVPTHWVLVWIIGSKSTRRGRVQVEMKRRQIIETLATLEV